MLNIDALKALYVALGGEASDVADMTILADVINAIAEIVPGRTLPAVTSDDDGKVLTVVDGAWAAATARTLPAVTAEDDGKVLTVVDGAWAAAK